jgi:hypothetical protein
MSLAKPKRDIWIAERSISGEETWAVDLDAPPNINIINKFC